MSVPNLFSSNGSILLNKNGCDYDLTINPSSLGNVAGLNLLGSNSVLFVGNGFTVPLQAKIKLSQNPGNLATVLDDGLFVQSASITESNITALSTTSISLVASGINAHTLTATAKVSADTGNLLSVHEDGLFVGGGSGSSVTDGQIRAALSGVTPILYNPSTGAFSIQQASSSQSGFLSSTDWTIFNAKEPAIAPGNASQYRRGDKTWATLNTQAVIESGGNFYFTQSRFDTALATKSSDNIPEGSTNFYATPSRVRAQITATGPVLFNSGTGVISLPAATTAASGYLTQTDWNTFNGKVDSAVNLGSVGFSIFTAKASGNLGLRKLIAGAGISLVLSGDQNGIVISGANVAPPVANASIDQTIVSPTSSVTLDGSASTSTGTILSTTWTKISGPSGSSITNAANLATAVTGLVTGTYVFRLTAVTSQGTVATDDVQITVSASSVSSDTIYYGVLDDGSAPILSEVTAGSTTSQNGAGDITINWAPLTSGGPKYAWFAIPNTSAAYVKNHWVDSSNSLNNGSIGTGDDLWGAPTQVTVSGTVYNVWITNYATAFTSTIVLSKV